MRLGFFLPLLFFTGLGAARAAPPVDLGEGLLYCRIHALPADLPTAETGKKSALVLDLRYVATDNAGATALAAWLSFHPAGQPLLVLVNADTSPALLRLLAAPSAPPGVVTLGPPQPDLTPDVPLNSSPATERRAYDALDHGATIESLTVEKIDKPRYDEATMVKDHVSDSAPPPDDGGDSDDAAADPAAKKPAPPPQLIDLALQRAIQLHRALLALHKIPRG
ncbi:MAG TPA: hypothetical protein VMI53_02065 [Opitutaceae bacterium]|nr:hypothetical protein [Opitutaceae bacterium]